jgi:hypothetical protein
LAGIDVTQHHETEWKRFAHRWKLNLKRVQGISCIEYEHASTRACRAAWDRRSELEASAEGPKAYYNAALQHAAELAFELHGEATAKVIQGLRK